MKVGLFGVIRLTCLLLFISSCSSTKKVVNNDLNEKYAEVAQQKYTGEIEYSKNSTGEYVLCVKKADNSRKAGRQLEFFVYDIRHDKVTIELTVGEGAVKWFDKVQIEVTTIPGVILKGYSLDDYTTLYNVLDGSSKPKISRND